MSSMTPDERAAMERYRNSEGSEIELDANGEPTGRVLVAGSLWDAVTDLADAFLCYHPEGEVTEEWLRSIGFETCNMPGKTLWLSFALQHSDYCHTELECYAFDTWANARWFIGQNGGGRKSGVGLSCTLATRGEVLMLLRALKIQPKE